METRRGPPSPEGEESPLLNAFPAPAPSPHGVPPFSASLRLFPSHSQITNLQLSRGRHTVKHADMKMVHTPEVVKLPHHIQPSVTRPLRREAAGGHAFPVSVFWTRLRSLEFGLLGRRQQVGCGVGCPHCSPRS